jgi:polyphosphate kinase
VSISTLIEELGSSKAFINRELSWLAFASRVLSLVVREDLPLLDRLKFAGITGMLHDEFFMKRISGLKREIAQGAIKLSIDGRSPREEFDACREEINRQVTTLGGVLTESVLPALAAAGIPILSHADLTDAEKASLRQFFQRNVQPILTPLAVDSEHPFPFISNLGLNLAVLIPNGKLEHFVRIKVPDNRPRWIPVEGRTGFVPIEQIIAANLDLIYPSTPPSSTHVFRVTRGADGGAEDRSGRMTEELHPGDIVEQVSYELKARRFAGVVRLQVDDAMPKKLVKWLCKQLDIGPEDVDPVRPLLGLRDLQSFDGGGRDDLRLAPHRPVVHPRLQHLPASDPAAIFKEIVRGDILLHHPYHGFDDSVLRFLESAGADPAVLAIKLTIYRTSADSPIVKALVEASRRGKQVAVLVEITARFDEAPNIAWGSYLEQEGVHVAYGVEKLKTHVKLALVVREERDGIRKYAHLGTGNYHTGTARIYEDLGLLTCEPGICDEVATVFNSLTGAIPYPDRGKLIVAPVSMRRRFTELIRREAEHAVAGRACGIDAKMNQLQDAEIIKELYGASAAGVPVRLNVRGLCCLRPGVPGLSDNVRVFGVVGRFLEHSRIFRFANGGSPEHFLGSADWMKRNLNSRIETVIPVEDPVLKRELDAVLDTYEKDNSSVWDLGADGVYVRRTPRDGEVRLEVQEEFIRRARLQAGMGGAPPGDVSAGTEARPPVPRVKGKRERGVSPTLTP